MQSKSLPKTLHYKRATYLQGSGNLQADIKKALSTAKTVGDRKQVVNASENTFLLANSVRNRWGMTFGSMLLYSRGRNQPLVTENDSAAELTVEQLAPPPDATGARRDFIESLLFFGILDNHIVLLQSIGLRARQFESHLAWLLQTKTKTLSEENRVALADQPSQNAIKQVLKSPVKRVTVGLPLETSPVPAKTGSKHLTFQPEGSGFSVLRSMLGQNWMKKLKLSDSLDHSRLKVEVHVTYTRTIDDSAQDLLNDIAVKLRHQEPDEVDIRLASGAKLTGDDLRVSGPVSVMTYGGLVDPEDLYPRMRDWLKGQLEQGIVEA